ncbi:MAG: ATP-binding cassette domain-containing protein [Humidesulfovibrio sp.]|nr:ATP-binding cassette domain-containing protein [Humidesulfovibrio sp.]
MTEAQKTQAAPLVRLEGASVTRGGALLLDAIRFKLMPGARWAVLGGNGAGKTTLLRLLRGDILPDHSSEDGPVRVFDLPGCGGPQTTPLGLRQRLALVSGDMQDLYVQNGWAATTLSVVLAGFYDSPLLYAEPSAEEREAAQATLAALGLAHLSDRRMASLSSGQGRAVLLARALACKPAALLLDECLEGLDAPARREFLDVLDRAALADPSLALLFCSHRTDELPVCLTHALALESGRIRAKGPLAEVLAELERQTPMAGQTPGARHPEAGPPDTLPPALVLAPQRVGGDFLARISDADVVVNGAHILHKISWTIRPGEHWAVLGKNGAGKSTLLSLLAGDFWPSALEGEPGRVEYGFAFPGETLDDTRRRVGRVSAALDRDYGWNLRVDEAVWSGASGSIGLYAEADGKAKARASLLMEFFGVAGLAARRIQSLSRGQLRRVMLARALMGFGAEGPALLLLDEPMAGLDTRARRAARELLGRVAGAGAPLVLVTHHERDLPEQINRVLVLDAGKVVFRGDRAAFAQWRTAERTVRTRKN